MSAITPQAVADAMFAKDRASRGLGMTIEEVGDGYARLSMEVVDSMLNGHDICHGGMIFSLADSAFAFACNSGNRAVVAAGCDIEYLRPARRGDRLTATAKLKLASGRTSYYDIDVVNQDGEQIASFRGRGRRIEGYVVPPEDGSGEDGK